MSRDRETSWLVIGAGLLVVVIVCSALLGSLLWAWPKYRIYSQTMRGTAKLRAAEQEKQILVEQARAEVDAAKLRAEAIRIVGEASKEYPEYRTQEFIGAFGEALREGNIDQIIYVPTETNIPILEASRHSNKPTASE